MTMMRTPGTQNISGSNSSGGNTGRAGTSLSSSKWSLGVFVPTTMMKKKSKRSSSTAKNNKGEDDAASKSSMLKRMSDRRLVKQISMSMLEVEKAAAKKTKKAGRTANNDSSSSLCSATFKKEDLSASSLGLLDHPDSTDKEAQVVPLFGGSSLSQTVDAATTGVQRFDQLPPLPAPLHRKELQLGRLLGSGGFSEVFALDGIQLRTKEMKAKLKSKSRSFAPQEYQAREILERRINTNDDGSFQDNDAEDDANSKTRTLSTTGFAVKHLSRDLLSKEDPGLFRAAAQDLEREAQLLSCINHPNIIRVRGLAMGGMASCLASAGKIDAYFVVMDRLTETLDARIQKWNRQYRTSVIVMGGGSSHQTPPALTTKIHCGMQLASALEFLHSRRLIYRDIKPPNVGFIQDPTAPDSERLQLFDFGLCRLLPMEAHKKRRNDDGEMVFHMSQAGSRRYLAPELYNRNQLRSKCYYNCKADVYSWALTFYEILSQRKPYQKFDCPEKLASHISEHHGRPCLDDIEERYHKNNSGNSSSDVEELVLHSLKRILHLSWTHYSSERPNMAGILNQLYPLLVLLEQGQPIMSSPPPPPVEQNKDNHSRPRKEEKKKDSGAQQPIRPSSSKSKKGSNSTEKAKLAPRTTRHAAGSDDISPQVVSSPRAA